MEWGQLVAAANSGDGTAVDHLIDARLKNELPPREEQTFAESCFLYWTRDGAYTRESKTSAAAHEPEELSSARDFNATRMDFRFIEASHMSRLLGIGFEGSWDVSVTFHPHSAIAVRILMIEEQGGGGGEGNGQQELYSKTRSWVRSGYKLVREWKRARVSSVRQNFASSKQDKKGLISRQVVYTVRSANAQALAPKKVIESIASGLTLRLSLSESPLGAGEDAPTSVLRIATSAVCTAGSTSSCNSVYHRGQLDLYGGSFCSLADWSTRADATDSIDAQHGASTLRCVRSETLSSTSEVSEMELSTVWLLHARGMHTFRASVNHELSTETSAKTGKLFGRMARVFKDSRDKSTCLSVSHSISMYVTCELDFADFLNKLGVMRRVRDGALSSNKSVQRLSTVGASARF